MPDWHEVFAAFRGELGHRPGDHLLTRWAQALAQLHRLRTVDAARGEAIDDRRRALIELIDGWVQTHVRPPASFTESVGAFVDEFAEAHVAGERLLLTDDGVTDETRHTAWTHTSEIATDWGDLVDYLIHGQPCWPPRTDRLGL
ncbi:hypothetical protein [Nocardia tenerifensis]|nr:hypothetical protein [Nocardia tenerifensis]